MHPIYYIYKIYLEARLVLQRTRIVKSVIQLIAFIAAWHTCMSRVSDFKHHHSDVIGGALIGLSVALFIVNLILKLKTQPSNALLLNVAFSPMV